MNKDSCTEITLKSLKNYNKAKLWDKLLEIKMIDQSEQEKVILYLP